MDLSDSMDRVVPESWKYRHSAEGADDMVILLYCASANVKPAHVKSSLLGPSLTVPITNGKLNLGTWQDIQLVRLSFPIILWLLMVF